MFGISNINEIQIESNSWPHGGSELYYLTWHEHVCPKNRKNMLNNNFLSKCFFRPDMPSILFGTSLHLIRLWFTLNFIHWNCCKLSLSIDIYFSTPLSLSYDKFIYCILKIFCKVRYNACTTLQPYNSYRYIITWHIVSVNY